MSDKTRNESQNLTAAKKNIFIYYGFTIQKQGDIISGKYTTGKYRFIYAGFYFYVFLCFFMIFIFIFFMHPPPRPSPTRKT